MGTTLTANDDWVVQAKLEIESFWLNYQKITDGTLTTLRNDINLWLTNHVGAVSQLRVNVFESWVASDTIDIAFVVKPPAPIETGDVSLWSLGDPEFSPPNSVSRWVWEGANARKTVFLPYRDHTAGLLWTDTAVVTSARKGNRLPGASSSESSVGGLFRSLNTVRSTDPNTDNRLSFSVHAEEAVKAATSWEIVPEWIKVLLTVIPLVIVVGGTLFIGTRVYRLVKG